MPIAIKRVGRPKGIPKTGGRKKGTPNRINALLKDSILEAAQQAGGKDGLVGYLRDRALDTPAGFLALLGKVLPLTLAGDDEKPVALELRWLPPTDR